VRGGLAPIVLVAIGPPDAEGERARALGAGVRRMLASLGDARLVCATVIREVPEWGTSDPGQTGAREHLRHRVGLQHWAAAAQLPLERVTFHVLEAADPGAAILEYIRANAVEHLVIGEPQPWTTSVGGTLAAEAPCTVTIVRQRI
jgi:nucleotide-binding universal stress UspA family protein